MTSLTVTPQQIRTALLLREEIALLDLRHEAEFATGHPLFAANMAAGRIALEAETRLPRKDVAIVLYDNGEGLVATARQTLAGLGYSNVRELAGGLKAWSPETDDAADCSSRSFGQQRTEQDARAVPATVRRMGKAKRNPSP